MKTELIPLMERVDSLQRRNQVIAVGGVTIALFATGNILGYSAIVLPSLLQPDSPLKAQDSANLSWIASMVALGCILGNLAGGVICDLIGRKRCIVFSSVIFFIGWVVIADASGVAEILAGRILTGMASGFYSTAVQVYICEIVEPELRGASGAIPSLMVSVGILATYCLGAAVEWRTVAYVSSIVPLIVLIYVVFLPESPAWLISKGHDVEALASLTWLRMTPEEAEQECMRLQYVKERRSCSGLLPAQTSFLARLKRFTKGAVLKPLLIGTSLFFFQQFSGIYPVTFYTTLIFRYAKDDANDYLETICVGTVRMFSTLIAIFLVNFFRRRTLLIMSGMLMFIANATLGTYFYLRIALLGDGQDSALAEDLTLNTTAAPEIIMLGTLNLEWVPLISLLVFMGGYSIGFGIIPWFLMAEIMPSDVRSSACSIAFSFGQLCLFIAVKTFLTCVEWIDADGTFWLYGGVAFTAVLFVLILVPETSNMPDDEIEDMFRNRESKVSVGEEQETGFIVDVPLRCP